MQQNTSPHANALAAVAFLAPAAMAQTAPHSLPPETFKFLSAKDVFALTVIHAHWTHYIHILAGEGTLVYGGFQPKGDRGPGQIRGDAITGGTSIAVHEGDYVQIPAGMPHLFNAAPGTRLPGILPDSLPKSDDLVVHLAPHS